jgi:hypothetical protein
MMLINICGLYPLFFSLIWFIFRRLMERLQNMRNNAAGDGENNCILCGEVFSFFTRKTQSK